MNVVNVQRTGEAYTPPQINFPADASYGDTNTSGQDPFLNQLSSEQDASGSVPPTWDQQGLQDISSEDVAGNTTVEFTGGFSKIGYVQFTTAS